MKVLQAVVRFILSEDGNRMTLSHDDIHGGSLSFTIMSELHKDGFVVKWRMCGFTTSGHYTNAPARNKAELAMSLIKALAFEKRQFFPMDTEVKFDLEIDSTISPVTLSITTDEDGDRLLNYHMGFRRTEKSGGSRSFGTLYKPVTSDISATYDTYMRPKPMVMIFNETIS